MKSYKSHFSRFLEGAPERLHFAAHSHHAWPDVSFDAHCQAWTDAAQMIDHKWNRVFSEVIPEAQKHIARRLRLPDASSIVFATNTHEFVVRLHSALPAQANILCSDAEFHSFQRQQKRWQEAGLVTTEEVPAEPLQSFGERFIAAAEAGNHSMVYLSQVFFSSSYVVDILEELADVLKDRETLLVIDGYHAFMALPVDLSRIASRIFYIAGGYKYAMSGEGVCFMHCPPGFAPRPVNTGWFAGFEGLSDGVKQVGYSEDGQRFAGATFDPSGLYRFNAVQRWLLEQGLSVEMIHTRIRTLQEQFLDGLEARKLDLGELIPGRDAPDRGHFLTFRSERSEERCTQLDKAGVMVDSRGDRLRFGFAIYHDPEDVDALLERLS
ncbi:MAG: aminotransferase class V-fold PLP-dependent enzyme [Kofleriaceae bacterium]|nr:aminotransferase class V-fold PLP-dependent enzyme [Kofleriaceae bacterium]